MEKIKSGLKNYDIISIINRPPLLEIKFQDPTDLLENDLSIIELFTEGGVKCTEFIGYNTVYKDDGINVILSNNGSIYIEPVIPEPIDPVMPTEEELLNSAKTNKLSEVSTMCRNTIYNGTDILTSHGSQHFSLTLEDQTNISYAYSAILNGATEFPYHADGELCTKFSAEDIATIAQNATAFKVYHTTYCNHLNIWINRCETIDEVNDISYGITLPDDLLTNLNNIIGL